MLLVHGSTLITDPVVDITYDNGQVVRVATDKETYHVARN